MTLSSRKSYSQPSLVIPAKTGIDRPSPGCQKGLLDSANSGRILTNSYQEVLEHVRS
jgi:hypothetical protein